MNNLKHIIIGLVFFVANLVSAQQSQEQLEQERKSLQSKIASIAKLKAKSQQKEKSLLDQVNALSRQVAALNRLVKLTNRQANYLNRKIKENTTEINNLTTELADLKEDYAKMIQKSYKSKSSQNRVMFLLSSESFLQAYKRISYMQQYTKFRKKQGALITTKTEKLKKLNIQLLEQRKQKEKLVVENRKTKKNLEKERLEQQKLIAQINSDQATYAKQIRAQQKKAKAIDRKIEKLIKEAIARANKKAGAKKNSKTFTLTAESKKLATNFTANRGKLPWPVLKGDVIKPFGRQRHPVLKNIEINNSGVDIETEENQVARAIFDGEVSTVQAIKGAGKLVQIRHGDFITTYYNIDQISVKEGDKVTTKQAIGKVHTNSNTGRSIIKFSIYQGAKFLNPQKWIYKMK